MGTRVGYWFAANHGGSTALSTVPMAAATLIGGIPQAVL